MQVTRDGELRLGGRDPHLVAVRLERHRCRGHIDDLVDEPTGNPADERDERVPLCGSGAAVHDDGSANRGRRHTADLTDAQIPIACDSGDDAQAIERDAIEGAVIDVPGHHGLPADGLCFARHDAAAREDLGGAGFDVFTRDGRRPGSKNWRGHCDEGGNEPGHSHGALRSGARSCKMRDFKT